MSEGSFWPKTWREAVPLIVWGCLIFAAGFEGIASLVHAEWWPSAASFGLLVAMTTALIHWRQITRWGPLAYALATLLIVISIWSPLSDRLLTRSSPLPSASLSSLDVGKLTTLQAQLAKVAQERDAAQQAANVQVTKSRGLSDQDAQRIAFLQSELNMTRQQLAAVQKQLPQTPVDPNNPPLRNPYPDGPVLTHKYLSDEAKSLATALRELVGAAEEDSHMSSPLELFFNSTTMIAWVTYIQEIGIDKSIVKMSEFSDRLTAAAAKLKNITAKYPTYTDDINRIIGNTNLESLQIAVSGYIGNLKLIKKTVSGSQDVQPLIIAKILRDDVTRVRTNYNDFRHWNQTFLDQRAPEARHMLEQYL